MNGESLSNKATHIKNIGKEVASVKVFPAAGTFAAIGEAEKYAHELGFATGSMCRDEPIAMAKTDKCSYIAKWRNIGYEDYGKIEGIIVSDDMREGAVEVIIFK